MGKFPTVTIYPAFHTLLSRVDCDVRVDHLALAHIIKSKAGLETTRIKRLLELISSYSFNLYYIKVKDMILSDFLSRQTHDDSDPNEIIPISFNIHKSLHKKYYNIELKERYLVQMHLQKKIKQDKVYRSPWCEENLRYEFIT